MHEPSPIARKLKLIQHSFKEHRNRFLLQYDLTSSQLDVLVYLAVNREKEIHQREIENWLHLTNPTVTGILNRLEEKNFILRTMNPKDRRFRRILLTEKGCCVLENIGQGLDNRDARIYQCMTGEERQLLEELLDRILDQITESKEEKPC